MNIADVSDQVNRIVAENRRLLAKSDADDATIATVKAQYDTLHAGVEDMIEDHRRIERNLTAERDRAVRAFTEINGLLLQTTDLITQALRARAGDSAQQAAPRRLEALHDDRLPKLPMPG